MDVRAFKCFIKYFAHTFIYTFVCVCSIYVKHTHIKCRQKHSNAKVMHKDSNSKRASLIFQKQKRKANKTKQNHVPYRKEKGRPSRNAENIQNKRKPASKRSSRSSKQQQQQWGRWAALDMNSASEYSDSTCTCILQGRHICRLVSNG